MLAPSVERSEGPAHDFAIAARDFYPDFLEALADITGIRVPLNRLGVLQVALSDRGVRGLQKTRPLSSSWIDRTELAILEPTLSHASGAVFNPDDGAVDNVILMSALEAQADRSPLITRVTAAVARVSRIDASVDLASGETLQAERVVIAAGAWSGALEGATGLAHVTPCRGQLVEYHSIGLRHVTYGPRGYLVPRTNGTLVAGSTMENVGFDSDTTPEGLTRVRSAAEEIAPGLAIAPVSHEWAGLRPITPDMLPIIGADAAHPHIIYAAGHSRNGVLLAPLTGEVVATLALDKAPELDISQFRPGRF